MYIFSQILKQIFLSLGIFDIGVFVIEIKEDIYILFIRSSYTVN